MNVYEMTTLMAQQAKVGVPYYEFLRVPALSAGLYALPAGGVDQQKPHTEDEIYFVVQGRATVEVEGEMEPVGPGALIYVAAQADHRFIEIEEDLLLLVLFAPAEGSAR